MTRLAHRSGLTNAQWKLLEPHIPAAKPGGRPRTLDMREVCNAFFTWSVTAASGETCRMTCQSGKVSTRTSVLGVKMAPSKNSTICCESNSGSKQDATLN